MLSMAETLVLPSAEKTILRLSECVKAIGGRGYRLRLDRLASAADKLMSGSEELRGLIATDDDDLLREAKMIESKVKPLMAEVRSACDLIELMVPVVDWKMPTYNDLLFLVS